MGGGKQVTVEREGAGWIVRLKDGEREQGFHCATEQMARILSSVLGKPRIQLS